MKLDIRSFFKKQYKTKLEESIDFTRNFNSARFKESYSSNLYLLTIETPYSNITKYILELNKLHQAMLDDRIIYNIELPLNYPIVTLYDFFLDEHGNYLDSITIGEQFIEITNKYLSTYLEMEQRLDKSFNTSKNLLTLNQLTTYTVEILLLIKKVL